MGKAVGSHGEGRGLCHHWWDKDMSLGAPWALRNIRQIGLGPTLASSLNLLFKSPVSKCSYFLKD